MSNAVVQAATGLIARLEETQQKNVSDAADCIVNALRNGGILQAFGCGHSHAGALEFCHRAGGLVPTKLIREPAWGDYEAIEGVGLLFMKRVEVLPHDVVFINSNSGRNPMPIEVALECKKRGAKVIALTSLPSSTGLTSRHSSGKRLYELADVVVDTGIPKGDACINIEGLDTTICGMSSIVSATAIQWIVLEVAQKMVALGEVPPFYKSQNLDGCTESNDQLMKKYISRIYHI
ncbi:MAG: SIS domain-containing protein [Oscillospiraceae bacterium]